MECHEGATMIKTFRGLIADGSQDTVVLHTNDGSTGYRIVKLNVISTSPGTTASESVVKIYKVSQTSITATIDFNDNTLLAVGYWSAATSSGSPATMNIIFDREVFNQDIYITHSDVGPSGIACNYYLELEQIKLDLNESTAATLKDIRNKELRTMIA